MMRRCATIICLLPLAAASSPGCHEPAGPRSVANPDPAVKVPAIKQAVAADDLKSSIAMINDLQSDDAAVRLFAIQGLKRLTGEDFGYHYYADPRQRAPAIERWKRWLKAQQAE